VKKFVICLASPFLLPVIDVSQRCNSAA